MALPIEKLASQREKRQVDDAYLKYKLLCDVSWFTLFVSVVFSLARNYTLSLRNYLNNNV